MIFGRFGLMPLGLNSMGVEDVDKLADGYS